jgi:hypothetical protein
MSRVCNTLFLGSAVFSDDFYGRAPHTFHGPVVKGKHELVAFAPDFMRGQVEYGSPGGYPLDMYKSVFAVNHGINPCVAAPAVQNERGNQYHGDETRRY